MPNTTNRIFLSYGTGDALDVASWLFYALTERGYQVFWDKEGLRETTGTAWDRHLEEAIRTHDVVVALMSPHSVRPEGECRNEISFAKDHGKPIVPVMVRQCERPLRIHDLQYVDLEAFPRVGDAARSAWLEEIIRFIENGVPVDPALSELRRRFRPLDYERVLRRNSTDPFVGREWLFNRIDQWLANPDAPSTLFVVGGPGVGKTSAMAHWCRGRLKVGAYHFCDHAQPDTARDVVASLAGQLLSLQALHPSYPEALRVLDTANRDTGDVSSGARDWTAVEWFRKLVLDPLRQDPPDTPWVLVMDALDEALPDVRKMLRECHSELPPQVRLLITSRPDRDLVAWYRGALEIDASSDDNQRDLRHYVEDRLRLLREAGRIQSNLDIADRFAVRLLDASAGTFLYCAEVLDSIAAGHRAVSYDTILPDGLGGVYAEFLGRNYPDSEGTAYRELRAALEVALGAKQTVDDRFIGAVLDIDVDDVADLRRSLGSLMVSGNDWRFFHKSFADWLGDGESSSYGVRPGRGVRRILKALDGSGAVLQKYALRWRAPHLIDEGNLDGARALLTDFAVLKSRVEAGLVRGVLEDMDALVRAASVTDWQVPEDLRVWQRLFRRRREFWEQFPDEFHQDCLNEAEGLPTTESAKAIPIAKPWIRWVNKPEHEVRHQWEWMVRDASCAAFSPDGKTVAVGGTDGSLRLLEAETGYEIWKVKGHVNTVWITVYSPDGSKVLSSAEDTTPRIWEISTGNLLFELVGHDEVVRSGEFSPDSTKMLTASSDKTVRLWNASDGTEVLVLRGHEETIWSAVFSPDGAKVLTASSDRTARVWDIASAAEILSLSGHSGWVRSAMFSPDGRKILTASSDCTARTWDATSGDELLAFRGHTKAVGTALFGRDGSTVLTKSFGETAARIWDAATGEELRVLSGHDDVTESAVFSPDGTRVLTASSDCTGRIWDATTGAQVTVLQGHDDRIRMAIFSPNGRKVLTTSSDRSVRHWDTLSQVAIPVLRGNQTGIKSIVFSSDSSRMISTAKSGVTFIWDTVSCTEFLGLDDVTRAVFSPDGKKVLVTSSDGSVILRDSESGNELLVLRLSSEWISSARFSPDGTKVLTSPHSRKLARLWDSATGEELTLSRENDRWIWESDLSAEQESRQIPTPIIASGYCRRGVRTKALSDFVTTWIQLDSSIDVCTVLPSDPLAFAAGCADGSVRFFRLEGVDDPIDR
jgi:WD40 repeat protein